MRRVCNFVQSTESKQFRRQLYVPTQTTRYQAAFSWASKLNMPFEAGSSNRNNANIMNFEMFPVLIESKHFTIYGKSVLLSIKLTTDVVISVRQYGFDAGIASAILNCPGLARKYKRIISFNIPFNSISWFLFIGDAVSAMLSVYRMYFGNIVHHARTPRNAWCHFKLCIGVCVLY